MDPNDPAARRDAMRAHLARGSTVQLNVDVCAPGVRLPDGVVRDAAGGVAILVYGPPHRLNIPIPDLDVGDAGVTATLSFDRVAAATFVPWAAVRGLYADAPRPAEPRCALCGRIRAQVDQLVAGDDGAVCNGCVPFALSILDGDAAAVPRWRNLLATLQAMLVELAPTTPAATSAPLLGAALALAASDLSWSRAIASHAMRLGQPAIARSRSSTGSPPRRWSATAIGSCGSARWSGSIAWPRRALIAPRSTTPALATPNAACSLRTPTRSAASSPRTRELACLMASPLCERRMR